MRSSSFLIFLRYIRKNKFMTLVSISGLAIGMAAVILIGLYVAHELSYDRFHPDAERIALITSYLKLTEDQELTAPYTSPPMAVDLAREINGIETWTRISTNLTDVQMSAGERKSIEPHVYFADSTFFDVLGYRLAQGDPRTALTQPFSMVLTKAAAARLFGNEDPIGKEVKLYASRSYTVTGVFDDVSQPSHLEGFGAVCSWITMGHDDGRAWMNDISYLTFIKAREGTDLSELAKMVDDVAQKHVKYFLDQMGGAVNLSLLPIRKVYLNSHFDFDAYKTGSMTYVMQFGATGLVILLIAMLNYVNLTTAHSMKRGRWVGINKSLGATRAQLGYNLTLESVYTAMIAVLLAVLLVELVLPLFNNLLGLQLSLKIFSMPVVIGTLILFGLFVGVASGFYPAIVLSRYQATDVIRGQLTTGRKGTRFRGALVVLQFTISIILIVSTFVVLRQISYLRNKDLGYDREHVLAVNLPSRDLRMRHKLLEEEMSHLPGVIDYSSASQLPTEWISNSVFQIPGDVAEEQLVMNVIGVDHRYMDMMKFQVIEGRTFNPALHSDSVEAIMINEAAARKLNWENVVGKKIQDCRGDDGSEVHAFTVIGKVKDFHIETMHRKIQPLLITLYKDNPNWLLFRLAPDQVKPVMRSLEHIWEEYSAGVVPLKYEFLDDMFDKRYRAELRMSSLFNYFTALAIFIACLGLYAITTFSAEQRTREIGIRKVLGASEVEIVRLLTSQFILLVLLANLFAGPIAWYLMNRWLGSFVYRIELGFPSFLLAGLVSLLIAVITVSWQAIRVALANPVKALRYE